MAIRFGIGGSNFLNNTVQPAPGFFGIEGPGRSSALPAGRSSTFGWNFGNANLQTNNLGGNFTTLIGGMAVYTKAAAPFGTNAVVMAFIDNGGQLNTDLRINSSGQLLFTRNGTTIGSPSSFALAPSNWYYIEVKVTFATTAVGSAEVRVNSNAVLTLTNVQTAVTNANAAVVNFLGGGSGVAQFCRDLYVVDGDGGTNTTYLGDVNIVEIFPNAAGTNQQWTLGAGASQTVAVQDGISGTGTRPDGDTTYITSATAGQISDFAHQTLSFSGQVLGVIHVSYLRKDDAGARQAAQVCLSGVTTEVGSTISLGNSYSYYTDILENDPNTSAQWTQGNFNSATFGIKEIT